MHLATIFSAHLIAGRFEVDKHLPYEDAPNALGVAVFHFAQPARHRRFLVLAAEQQLHRVPLYDVL